MLTPHELTAHYARVQSCFEEMAATGTGANYLGHDLRTTVLWQPAECAARKWFAPGFVTNCIQTKELALDCGKFRELIRTRIMAFPEITTCFERTVHFIERGANGFVVGGSRTDGTLWREAAEVVVNCLWNGRLALDRQLGIVPSRAFVMRLKYRLWGALDSVHSEVPSMTMVCGHYGDVVAYANGAAYFSWYPACLRGWSSDWVAPQDWDGACAGNPPKDVEEIITRETLAAFERLMPGMAQSRIDAVDAGVIYSWGETDIDDYASALHQRHDIGFTAHDGYYSVDTGKFTCAPLFAQQLAEHLDE